jgi:hypothetical protein
MVAIGGQSLAEMTWSLSGENIPDVLPKHKDLYCSRDIESVSHVYRFSNIVYVLEALI